MQLHKNLLSNLGTDDAKPSNVNQYAHCEITICHPAIDLDSELLQV